MKSLRLNPIVLILINIVAPSQILISRLRRERLYFLPATVAGVYLGYVILRKHLEKKDVAMV